MAGSKELIIGTALELADWLGCSDRHIQKLAQEGTISKLSRGNYDLKGCIRQIFKHLSEKSSGESSDLKNEKYEAEIENLKARTEREKMLSAQAAGQLLDASEVKRVWTKHITSARARLLGLPARMAAEIAAIDDPALVQAALQRTIDEALIELGAYSDE